MLPPVPAFATMFSYCVTSTSRPCTVTEYCIWIPAGTGGTPMRPAGATTFCSCTMRATSLAVTPRRAILSGSSQMRML